MNITMINGNTDPDNQTFLDYTQELVRLLTSDAHTVHQFDLINMDIRYCTGCWYCWTKTPGVCIHKDDMPEIYPVLLASDLVLLNTPIIRGFVTDKMKSFFDRMIPLVHPYIKIKKMESKHRRRYRHYPDFAAVVQLEESSQPEDVKILDQYFRRVADTIYAEHFFTRQLSSAPEEVKNEINNL